jgi:hypothetical protein
MNELEVRGIGNVSDYERDRHGNWWDVLLDGKTSKIYWAARGENTLRWDKGMSFSRLIAILTQLHDQGHIYCDYDIDVKELDPKAERAYHQRLLKAIEQGIEPYAVCSPGLI